MPLSPLLQTDEIKAALNTAIQERTREGYDRVNSSPKEEGERRLMIMRDVINEVLTYDEARYGHQLSNKVIAEQLFKFDVINREVYERIFEGISGLSNQASQQMTMALEVKQYKLR